jgi:hypothetical protein
MLKNVGLLLLAIQLQLVAPLTSLASEPEQLSSKLGAVVHDYNLTANNFLDGLAHVASEFRIPIGIEWVNMPASRRQITLHWSDATVAEILETITHTQTGYSMDITNGVVHIYSTDILRDQDFVHLRIKSFVAHDEVVQMAERRLRHLVKLTTAPTELGPRGGIGGSLAVSVNEPIINVQANDASVQDILDLLVTASAKKIWVVTFVDNSVPTATGFRRTLTLWSKSPVPDDEQPVWNMFGWGQPLPLAGLEVR